MKSSASLSSIVIAGISSPHEGWIKSTRRISRLSLQAVADRLNVSPQAVHQFEKSETAGTISLRQLGLVANTLGCRLVYALVPRENGDVPSIPHDRHGVAAPAVEDSGKTVEHSLLLDNQAAGRFD